MEKLYVVYHKDVIIPLCKRIVPIGVGRSYKSTYNHGVMDCTLDSISKYNDILCENTALYWMWKNDVETEFIGLAHYRRYLVFEDNVKHKLLFNALLWMHEIIFKSKTLQIQYKDINSIPNWEKLLTPPFQSELNGCDIILPNSIKCDVNIEHDFIVRHGNAAQDLIYKFKEMIHNDYQEYEESMLETFSMKRMYLYNMFITRKDFMDSYCEWAFPIFFRLMEFVDIPNDSYQKRIIAFFSERLFNIYLTYKKAVIKECPVLYVSNREDFYHKLFSEIVRLAL